MKWLLKRPGVKKKYGDGLPLPLKYLLSRPELPKSKLAQDVVRAVEHGFQYYLD